MAEARKNLLKSRLADGLPCVGGWLTTGSSQVAEALASLGFHWLALDMEHGSADISQAEAVFVAAERHGVAPLVRISGQHHDLARRLLDMGAAGLIVSTVESAADFRAFALSCQYPPAGRRGVGLSRCNRWGDDFDSYMDGFQPLLVPQIETRAGVEAAAGIAAEESVDALFLGPYDLSCDLGHPGNFNAADVKKAIQSVKTACTENGKAAGIHQIEADTVALQGQIDDGFTFIAYSTDMIAMRGALGGVRNIAGTTND